MEKNYLKYFVGCFFCFYVFSLLCSNFSLYSQELSDKNFAEMAEEDSRQLLEYNEIFEEFDRIAEEESEIDARGFFLKKWVKKSKKWFVKTVSRMLIKMVPLKKFKSREHCAYEVAKFKRKINKKLYKTADIEDALSEFSVKTSDSAKDDMEKFKDRIRYYYHHKDEKPSTNTKIRSDLENIPIRAVIGGLEIACGGLIYFLPFPGCSWLGASIATIGVAHISEAYINKIESENDKKQHCLSSCEVPDFNSMVG